MGVFLWNWCGWLEGVAQTSTDHCVETLNKWLSYSVVRLTKPLCDPTLWAFCQSYRAWEEFTILIPPRNKIFFQFGTIGWPAKFLQINSIRCQALGQCGSLWDFYWSLTSPFYQMAKFPAPSETCSSLMKTSLNPWFVTVGYHRTIAKQFTQRSGHHQKERFLKLFIQTSNHWF